MSDLPIPPSGFQRATGVVEGRRRCMACGQTYPVTDHSSGKKCPTCGSDQTAPLAGPDTQSK